MEKTLKVQGMKCHSCEVLLASVASGIKGVEGAKADAKRGTVTVRYSADAALTSVKAAMQNEGYVVSDA